MKKTDICYISLYLPTIVGTSNYNMLPQLYGHMTIEEFNNLTKTQVGDLARKYAKENHPNEKIVYYSVGMYRNDGEYQPPVGHQTGYHLPVYHPTTVLPITMIDTDKSHLDTFRENNLQKSN